MSPRYWACSEEELSEDSSASESTRSRDNDQSADEEISRSEGLGQEGSGFRSQNAGTIAQIMTPDSYSRLPQRQTRQYAKDLFHLSLIEGRCRTQAAISINARRRPEDQLLEDHPEVSRLTHELFSGMKSDLVRNGLIPEEFADNHLPDLRPYLNSFDVVLNSLATKHTSELPAKHNYRAIAGTRSLALNTNPFTTYFDPSHALIRRQHNLTMSPITSVLANLHPSVKDKVLQKSIFDTEYTKLAELGMGGFGKVYRAQHNLDQAEYAIKEIVISASELSRLVDSAKIETVLSEVRAMAKLDHHHLVRYFHCWIETREPKDTDDEDSGTDDNGKTKPRGNVHTTRSITLDAERELEMEFTYSRRRPSSVKSVGEAANQRLVPYRPAPTPNDGFFYEPGEQDENDGYSESHKGFDDTLKADDGFLNTVLFIKMTAYPLSLEDYIWSDQQETNTGDKIEHCFHALPTVQILLAVLDGVEYLHRKGIIHRDLKPANIFLSILDPTEPPKAGYINVKRCAECSNDSSNNGTLICPCVGDFGLITQLRPSESKRPLIPDNIEDESSKYIEFDYDDDAAKEAAAKRLVEGGAQEDTPAFSTTDEKHVGTFFYGPPPVRGNKSVTCPKFDVYSLGIIAFELLYKLKTKRERGDVLKELRRGIFPNDFGNHILREGIQHMICKDRENRWDCAAVRSWLMDIKKNLE